MAKFKNYSSILFYRGLIYIFLVAFLSIFYPLLFNSDIQAEVSKFYVILFCVTLIQFIFSFKIYAEEQIVALFLADAAASMILVKETGGSASPFTLLFPILCLSGAALFEKKSQSWILVFASIIMMSFSVGLRPAIIGNALAVVGTTLFRTIFSFKITYI